MSAEDRGSLESTSIVWNGAGAQDVEAVRGCNVKFENMRQAEGDRLTSGMALFKTQRLYKPAVSPVTWR